MPSKILLQFEFTLPTDGQTLALKPGFGSNGLKETFRVLRTASFQSTIGINVATTRGDYIEAFEADYNTTNLFTLVPLGSFQLEIEHPDENFFVIGDVDNQTGGSVTIVSVVDTADPTLINITDVSFSEATSACTDVQLDITTDVLAVIYRINGGSNIVNAVNPFDFEHIRGQYIKSKHTNTSNIISIKYNCDYFKFSKWCNSYYYGN